MPVFLLEIDRRINGVVSTLRLATTTITTAFNDTPASEVYRGEITDVGQLSRSISLGAKLSVNVNVASFEIGNADGQFDSLFDQGVDDAEFRLKEIASEDSPVSGATLVARGLLKGIDGSNALRAIRLNGEDMLGALSKPLLTSRYGGTTLSADSSNQADGTSDLAGTLKPGVLGSATNVQAVLINPFRLIYQVSVWAVSGITVYDGAAALEFTSNFATLAELIGATLVRGQYATCRVLGLFRLGGDPEFIVTADVTEGATASLRSGARVAQRILSLFGVSAGNINATSFDALHALYSAEVELFVQDESTALDLIQRVLYANHAVMVPTAVGVYQAVAIAAPGSTPADTFTLRDITAQGGTFSVLSNLDGDGEGEGVPAYRVNVNYGPVWRIMAVGDMVGSTDLVSLTRRDFLSKAIRAATPAEDLTVRTNHPRAVELTFDTVLKTKTDADAFATRMLALYKVRRDRVSAPIPGTRGRRQLGDTVALRFNRLGYDAGHNFLVVGRVDDFSRYSTAPELWG